MRIKKLTHDFKAFAIQGNVTNLAIGIMIGGAFSKIVTSLVNDIFTPILGIFTGNVDFSGLFIAMDGKQYDSIQAATAKGVGTLNYGAFLTNVIDFFLISVSIFIVIQMANKVITKKPEPEAQKPAIRQCPYCYREISAMASRCPECTSIVEPIQKDA